MLFSFDLLEIIEDYDLINLKIHAAVAENASNYSIRKCFTAFHLAKIYKKVS